MSEIKITRHKSPIVNLQASNGETESETIDDYSQYSDNKDKIASDSRSGTPVSNSKDTKTDRKDNQLIEMTNNDRSLNEDKDNSEDVMVEISKKTTIKKIISRTTSINGVTQATEVEESIKKDSHINDFPKLANSARRLDRRKSSAMFDTSNARKDSNSSTESVEKENGLRKMNNDSSHNKISNSDKKRETERRKSIPERMKFTKSPNTTQTSANNDDEYHTLNIHKGERNGDIFERIPITKSQPVSQIRERDDNKYYESYMDKSLPNKRKNGEQPIKPERFSPRKSGNTLVNKANDTNMHHESKTDKSVPHENIDRGRKGVNSEKIPITKSHNKLQNTMNENNKRHKPYIDEDRTGKYEEREENPSKPERTSKKKPHSTSPSRENYHNSYYRPHTNDIQSHDKDLKTRKSGRRPHTEIHKEIQNNKNDNDGHRTVYTPTEEIHKKEHNNSERYSNSPNRYQSRENGRYHRTDNPFDNNKPNTQRAKSQTYEEYFRPNGKSATETRNPDKKKTDQHAIGKNRDQITYKENYLEKNKRMKNESSWDKESGRNNLHPTKTKANIGRYLESNSSLSKLSTHEVDEVRHQQPTIKWVDPSKSEYLKYDLSDAKTPYLMKYKNSSVIRSQGNSKTDDAASVNKSTSDSIAKSTNSENKFHKDVKQYIIRGNIKEDLFQKRYPFNLRDNSSNNRSKQMTMEFPGNYRRPLSKSHNALNNINGMDSSSINGFHGRKNDNLSHRISKIIDKFDLMEQQIKSKSNSTEVLSQCFDDVTLSCGYRCCYGYHSHFHCSVCCCHSCGLNSEAPMSCRKYRPNEYQLDNTLSKSYELIENEMDDENSDEYEMRNSIDLNTSKSFMIESKYSHKSLHEKHINFLEKKLDNIENKMKNIQVNGKSSRFDDKAALEFQCQDVERLLKSLYETIPA